MYRLTNQVKEFEEPICSFAWHIAFFFSFFLRKSNGCADVITLAHIIELQDH